MKEPRSPRWANSVLQVLFVASVAVLVIAYGLDRFQVSDGFTTRRLPSEVAVELSSGGRLVGDGGEVTVVLYNNYACPFCADWWTTLESVMERDMPSLVVRVKHLTVPGGDGTYKAALAAECAADQQRFREYHRRLYQLQDLDIPSLLQLAHEVEVSDIAVFTDCLNHELHRETVDQHYREAELIELVGTPSTIAGRVIIEGVPQPEAFLRLLQ